MIMKNLLLKLGLLSGIAFGLSACYPGGAEYTSDTDLVVTDYSEEYNFKAVQTYFISDSIQHVLESGENPDYSLDTWLINQLASNFDNLGWQRLDTVAINGGAQPDVAVVVTIAKVTNYNVYYGYPWYGGWGWGWYKDSQYWGYPGYGWGYYPYYPTYVTSYETGTVVWRLFDPANIDDDNKVLYLEWQGAINGVVGSSTTTTQDRITKGIEQAFRQSPYLIGE